MVALKNNSLSDSPLSLGKLTAFLAGLIIFTGNNTGKISYAEEDSTSINDIRDLGSTRLLKA